MPAERKRPWYLVMALLGALAMGMTSARDGLSAWAFYREPFDVTRAVQGVANPADQAELQAHVQTFVSTLDAAKSRGWPMAVAALVIGGAMVVFAMRALGGRGGARAVLVQLVIAQAGLNAAAYWLLRDVMQANTSLLAENAVVDAHERALAQPHASDGELFAERARLAIARASTPIETALSALASLLVIVGLTRRRSREFFDASPSTVEER